MNNFTQNDLLLYLFNESTPVLTQAIEKALTEDWALAEELKMLKETHATLQMELQSPRTETILKVLNYARETMPATA